MVASQGIRTGPQDVAFLTDLGTYGSLSTEDACDYYPEHRLNSVYKRLRLLAANGLTRATKLEVWKPSQSATTNGGRIPTLHTLTDEGARLVELETGERPLRVLRSRPSAMTFYHRRQIVRVMRALDQAADAVGLMRPQWVMEQDVWHASPKSLPPNQRRLLYHDLGNGLICQPDLACRFRINETELMLLWEIDPSSEGTKQLRKAPKTDSYVALIHRREYRRYWPDLETNRNHVVWVTPSRRRFASLKEVLGQHPLAPVCRLLSAESLTDPETLLTSPVWETVDGQPRAMYRPSA